MSILETLPEEAPSDPSAEPEAGPQGCYEEVWAGPNREMAEALRFVFREHEIPCRLEQASDEVRVTVLQAHADHARALVRQVVEGEVPEGLEET